MSQANIPLSQTFQTAEWLPSQTIQRPFVRFLNHEQHAGVYWHWQHPEHDIELSIIIPTADADRDGYFMQLLQQLEQQTWTNFELIVIKGDKRQGRAINAGVALATAELIMTLDDDSSLPQNDTLKLMVQAMRTHPDIGMAGGNNTIPQQADAFIKRAMREIPRRSWKPVEQITESDLAEHPCLIMRRAIFIAIGGEHECIPRGLDPYLRQQFRAYGCKIVVLPKVIYHHLPPKNLRILIKQFYRNGFQAAYANVHYPEWVIETPQQHGDFNTQVPLYRRILRTPMRMLRTLASGQFLWLACQCSYASGALLFWAKHLCCKPSK